MPPSHFTVDEANALLPAVRALAERMVEHRRKLARAQERRDGLTHAVAGNGGGIYPQELGRAKEAVDAEVAGVARCIDGLHQLGVLVKDLDLGLVDFPTVRDGEEALLCWHVGEDEIRYWHGLEEGFAGRKEL